ncbi:hypothetical protein BDQ17DRAFT_1238084 [Cyathus striatus]|nr:hypothetical protein BDQ17DRAFT_1238084 [Cyathus striatus]
MPSIFGDPNLRPPLDESLYSLNDEESSFYKTLTGIQDDEELKHHIIDVQTKAYQVYGYPCIRRFAFTRLKISRLPAYSQVAQLRQQQENRILLDLGCCFGNDTRKAVVDGWPTQNIVASDLRQAFWDYGHELFRSTPDTFPVTFVAGDVFDSATINPREPFYDEPSSERPDIKTLKSLTPLQGHISVVHASSFFHLFNEEKQLELARQVASLLSPSPGSVIFGSHGGRPVKGYRIEGNASTSSPNMFFHSPQSWTELWDGIVFRKGSVRVEATLTKIDRPDLPHGDYYLLMWSVTRL